MTGRRAKHNERGFTLVELVTILVLVGILAVVALPRVTDMSVFQEKGFSAEVAAAFRFARQAATASGEPVTVSTSGNRVQVKDGGGVPLPHPARGGAYDVAAPGGITLGGAGVTFDAMGRAGADAAVQIGGRTVLTIVGETGCLISP